MPNPGLAGLEFGEKTGPNTGLEFGFGERNGPNPGSTGFEFGERTWPNPDLEIGSEFGERNGPNPGAAGSEFGERIFFFSIFFFFLSFFSIFFSIFSSFFFFFSNFFYFFFLFFFSFFFQRERTGQTLIRSFGSEFGSRERFEVWRKEWAQLWFSRFGVRKKPGLGLR